MDLLPTDEQQQLIDSVRSVFSAEFSVERLRPGRLIHDDGGRRCWSLIGELGFFGLSLPENCGGAALSAPDEALLFREAGRFLVSPSLLAQVLAVRLAMHAGLDPARLLAGVERAALLAPLRSAQLGDTLDGEFHLFDGDGARWLVAWNGQGAALIEANCLREIHPAKCLDEALPLAKVALHAVPAAVYAGCPDSNYVNRAMILLAAQLVGVSEAARDAAVQHAKTREQFAQPIGAFQVIKHRCADMALRCEAGWLQTVFAACAQQAGYPDTDRQAAAAVLMAVTAANDNAAAALQIHGGLGYTAACEMHRLVKRARVLERLAGGTRLHQRNLSRGGLGP